LASGYVHALFRTGCDKGLRAFAVGLGLDRGSIVDHRRGG